jgi:hypothetical protein
LDERHILIYVAQPDLAAVLAQQGGDGAIRSASSDYLMIVDANLGYNKVNASITQSVNYTIDFSTTTNAQATLRVDYHHLKPSSEPCRQDEPYAAGITYQSMMGRCYYDYVRIYVPRGSQLRSASRQNIPASYFLSRRSVDSQAEVLDGEAGKSVYALFLVVEPGRDWEAGFSYELPPDVTQRADGDWRYSLWIQKQPGKLAIPTVVTLNLPLNAEFIAADPAPRVVQGNRVQFEFLMTKDTHIVVRFRKD